MYFLNSVLWFVWVFPLPKRNIYSILWIILWLIYQGNVSLFSVTMSGTAWILDVVLSKFVLYKLSKFSKNLVTSSNVWRFECQWRGKYQVSKFYIAIPIRPSACHWSQIKHKTNRLDESHSALHPGQQALPCDGLMASPIAVSWTQRMWKAFSFSALAF